MKGKTGLIAVFLLLLLLLAGCGSQEERYDEETVDVDGTECTVRQNIET